MMTDFQQLMTLLQWASTWPQMCCALPTLCVLFLIVVGGGFEIAAFVIGLPYQIARAVAEGFASMKEAFKKEKR